MKKGFYAFVCLAVVFAIAGFYFNNIIFLYATLFFAVLVVLEFRKKTVEIKILQKDPADLPIPNIHLLVTSGRIAVVRRIDDILKIMDNGTKGYLDLHQGIFLFDKEGILQCRINGGNSPDVKMEMFIGKHAYALCTHLRPFSFIGEIACNDDGQYTPYHICVPDNNECRHALFCLPNRPSHQE